MKYRKSLLLTGAGFTANFGGFLNKEMWSRIFNHPSIQGNTVIKTMMFDGANFDFETVYHNVASGARFSVDEKMMFRLVVEKAYSDMDAVIKDWLFDGVRTVNSYLLGEFFSKFSGNTTEQGLIFTLNQDLFLERHFQYKPPGVKAFSQKYYVREIEIPPDDFVTLPNIEELEKHKKDIEHHAGPSYIKLHGSYGLKSSDGKGALVLGKNKRDDIAREPLLNWYHELLQEAIYEGGKKLFVIGYSFRDIYINQILLKGTKEHGLSLYIINPSEPSKLRRTFERDGHFYAIELLDAISGYCSYPLVDIFPPNQSRTKYYDDILKALI